MASDSKKGKFRYSETDKVDDYLLNQVMKHVNPEELDSMARDLFVEQSVYQGIENPKNRIYKVILRQMQSYQAILKKEITCRIVSSFVK